MIWWDGAKCLFDGAAEEGFASVFEDGEMCGKI